MFEIVTKSILEITWHDSTNQKHDSTNQSSRVRLDWHNTKIQYYLCYFCKRITRPQYAYTLICIAFWESKLPAIFVTTNIINKLHSK